MTSPGKLTPDLGSRMTSDAARRLLEPLGPAGLRLGQLLALRPEWLAPGCWDPLLQLRDRTKALPFDQILQAFSKSQPDKAEELFASMHPHPLFTSWSAQIHAARTPEGDEVAIKVIRPGAYESVEESLGRKQALGRVFEALGVSSRVAPDAAIDELRRTLRAELDLALELWHLSHLGGISKQGGHFCSPRPYPELSGPGVLTTEHQPGVPLSEILAVEGADRCHRLARADLETVAANLSDTVIEQSLRHRLVQADVHPDNILVLPGGRLAFLSCAHFVTLGADARQNLTEAMLAIDTGAIERLFDALTDLLVGDENSDLSNLRASFLEDLAREPAGDENTPASRHLLSMLSAADHHRFHVPPGVRAFCRSLSAIDRLAAFFEVPASQRDSRRRLLHRLQVDTVLEIAHPDSLQPAFLDLLKMARDGPRLLRRLLSDLAGGQLVLHVRTVASEEDRRRDNVRARLITTALLSVGIAFLLNATRGDLLWDHLPLSWVLWPLLIAAWICTIAQWRKLR